MLILTEMVVFSLLVHDQAQLCPEAAAELTTAATEPASSIVLEFSKILRNVDKYELAVKLPE